MKLPNFLLIAPPKTATTWFYLSLREHPNIYMPFKKEVRYFDIQYHQGLEWYKRYYLGWNGQAAVGEVSTAYLRHPEAAARIYNDLGPVRIITCLRDPVDRAYSRYKQLYKKNAINVSFAEAVQSFPELIEDGLYYEPMKRYVDLFGLESILVFVYEEFSKEPVSCLRKVHQFLGLTYFSAPALAYKRVLPEEWHMPVFKAYNRLSQFLRKNLGLSGLIDKVKQSPVLPAIDSIMMRYDRKPARSSAPEKAREIPPMTHEDAAYLWRIYSPEIAKLEDMLKVDLGFWKKHREGALYLKNEN